MGPGRCRTGGMEVESSLQEVSMAHGKMALLLLVATGCGSEGGLSALLEGASAGAEAVAGERGAGETADSGIADHDRRPGRGHGPDDTGERGGMADGCEDSGVAMR